MFHTCIHPKEVIKKEGEILKKLSEKNHLGNEKLVEIVKNHGGLMRGAYCLTCEDRNHCQPYQDYLRENREKK